MPAMAAVSYFLATPPDFPVSHANLQPQARGTPLQAAIQRVSLPVGRQRLKQVYPELSEDQVAPLSRPSSVSTAGSSSA